LDRAGKEHGVDLESREFGLRSVVLSAGARLLEKMLWGVGSGRRQAPLVCSCGEKMRSQGLKKKRIKTILGDIRFNRSLYMCPVCGTSRFAGDELLDVEGTVFSPGVRRLMARTGGCDTFKEGRGDLFEFALRCCHLSGRLEEFWEQRAC